MAANNASIVKKLLASKHTAIFVSHDKQDGLVSRPMTTQSPEFDGDVWFFVSSDADLIDEVEANSDVNIAYSDGDEYLSLSGAAEIVDDDSKKKELWYDELAKWFKGATPESPDVRLIKVSADTARYWSMAGDGPPEEFVVDY
jgi:general stress protein 26